MTTILWFRRDLRLDDHPALSAAAADGDVLPIFVVDPAFAGSGATRLAFLHDCLTALDAAIRDRGGPGLVIRHGEPDEVVAGLAVEVGASSVHVTRDAGPYGRRRDRAVKDALDAVDVGFVGTGTPYAVAPGTVRKDDGDPYAVFTPFAKRWRATGWEQPIDAPDDVPWASAVESDPMPARSDPGHDLPPAGEEAALDRWHAFLDEGLDGYADGRDRPAIAGTSQLSPALKWGTIHPRRLLADLDPSGAAGEDHATFVTELAWREFYADVLQHRPETAWENLRQELDAMPVDTDAAARRRFERWAAGATGFGIVDAGMRQLAATGWMHNRVRMITASFLVKDLHLPWQWGARWFMEHLVDGDLASNNHNWQWVAGSGTDAAPYFRIFNPHTQQERFDPDGAYVERWVDGDGREPMVDHATEREEALRRLATIRT
jgi:deoxyribodipyrimidine photo-lyase